MKSKRDVRIGSRFGRLIVEAPAPPEPRFRGDGGWICLCDCGNRKAVYAYNLLQGRTSSCGCVNRENATSRNFKHGLCDTPEYASWAQAKQRVSNPKNRLAKWYRRKGITMCDRWFTSFTAFLEDMGRCPSGMTLDRINNDGNYEPGNCRWADRRTQMNNRSNVHKITFNGRTLGPGEWDRELGFPAGTVKKRLWRKWPEDRALSTPLFWRGVTSAPSTP
jgi:hypothetical protein